MVNYHEKHAWIKKYIIEYCKFNIRSDTLTPGTHEEVLRQILETSVAKGFITIEQINSYNY
jgi:hypothetical protein